MRKVSLTVLIMMVWTSQLLAGVDLQINLNLGAPEIEFAESPTVVLAAPGIYVVPDYPQEVFFISGFYWVIHGEHWYRCAGPHQKWMIVEAGRVPRVLVRTPRGKYKNWHPEKGGHDGFAPGKSRGHGKWK